MSRGYSIDCSLNDEYEAEVQIEVRLSYDRHCYDPSYASMLVAMLMTMLMAMFLAIAGRSSLGYRVVPKPTLFRVSLCSSEPYR